jgi:hypothetical protein
MEDTIMQQYIIAACATAMLLVASIASALENKKNCIRGYGKTPTEAFKQGVKLAERVDAEQGGGEKCRNASARIHILPEKVNGLYVAEVYFSPRKGSCDLKPEYKTAEVDQP